MRLAIVIKDYDESKGGAERFLVGLIPRLTELCTSVDLIVNRVNGKVPIGIKLQVAKAANWSSILYPLTFNWSVQKIIRKNKYDAVYGLTQIYPQDIYRAGGGLEHSWFEIRYKKICSRLLNLLRLRTLVRFYIENRIFQKGNYKKIITNSNLCKNQILHHYNVSPEDIEVIYNGVDKSRFNVKARDLYKKEIRNLLSIPIGGKVILFMSNNWKRKGLAELLKAFSGLKDGNVWLIIAGRGNQKDYDSLVKNMGIDGKIKFCNPTKEPEKFYGASDIFVLPTYYDPCANVCLEAMSCGLPVITTRTNGASELIREGINGFIIDEPEDVQGLMHSLEKALKIEPEEIQDTMNDLTIENNVEKTFNLLKMSKQEEINNILINRGYREILCKKGWNNFATIMQTAEGIQYKKNKLRSVVKVYIEGKNVFLKRHYRIAKPSWAFREWQNIFKLKSLGINTMQPIAIGEQESQSFIITESLEHATRLEDFINKEKLGFMEKKELVKELASLTRRMHNNNLFHKDFYTGHIFVEKENNKFKLYLIDLQRVKRHWVFRNHWRIKDIASLNFSSPEGFITKTDRMRFLKYYFYEEKLNKYKIFTNAIINKTNQIAEHTDKLLKRRKGL